VILPPEASLARQAGHGPARDARCCPARRCRHGGTWPGWHGAAGRYRRQELRNARQRKPTVPGCKLLIFRPARGHGCYRMGNSVRNRCSFRVHPWPGSSTGFAVRGAAAAMAAAGDPAQHPRRPASWMTRASDEALASSSRMGKTLSRQSEQGRSNVQEFFGSAREPDGSRGTGIGPCSDDRCQRSCLWSSRREVTDMRRGRGRQVLLSRYLFLLFSHRRYNMRRS
jgi:hypothetical protein